MSMSYSRASRLASICHKEFDFQFFVYQEEVEYKTWLTTNRISKWILQRADNTQWNCFICVITLLAIIDVAVYLSTGNIPSTFWERWGDIAFNIIFGVNAAALCYYESLSINIHKQKKAIKFGYVLDILSYSHYLTYYLYNTQVAPLVVHENYKIICYYMRLYRPLRYLWYLNDNYLTGSVIGTTLKYVYIFVLLRVSFSILWIHLLWYQIKSAKIYELQANLSRNEMHERSHREFLKAPFFWCLYLVDKLFIPIGPQTYPFNDLERLLCMFVMLSGTIAVTGITVATMAIVLSVSLEHEELYRARFRLIMNDMVEMRVPLKLREKVQTFYKMYWHKQKGVSGSVLMPTFPPTTYNLIYSEIYFEAQQKSRILRDLSNQFLTELAKSMTTINYIPGDSIIKRNSTKSFIIYISYGDVEMMTAEDDVTPMLRFSRGTVINGCGACPAAGCARSHVEIRAATFCTAHVLSACELWKVAAKFGKSNGQAFIILSSFEEHFDRVRRHYAGRNHPTVKYKSSILFIKRNLMDLKDARDADGKLLLERIDVFLEVAGCYVMRNRKDASLTDESDKICLRSTMPCILQPASSLLVAWNSFVALLTLIISITHPYNLVHKRNITTQYRFFDYFVSGIFILDIITHLSTGAKIEEGVPISFKKTSVQQMKSVWFALDVLCVLPIFEFVGQGYFAGINKLWKLPKFFRTLKEMESVAVYYSNTLRFISYSLLILMSSYLLACIKQGFMCFTFDYCDIVSLSDPPFWGEVPLNTQDAEATYMRFYVGLYWATSILAFSMDKTMSWGAELWKNRFFTMIVLEGSIIILIFVESVYSATMIVNMQMKQEYEATISKVKEFLYRNNVDPLLMHRFISYLQLCWHTDRAYAITHNKQSLLFDLPPHVSAELLYVQRSKYIMGLPFAKYLSEADLTLISSRARLFYTCPNEILQNTGDVCSEMYIIKQGICEVLNPETKQVVKTLSFKGHFGILECLLRIPSYYTVRAVTNVQVLSIHHKHLRQILMHPKFKDAIKYAKRQQEYKSLLKSRESFLTYVLPEPTPNRSKFPLPRKHEPDTSFLHPFHRLGLLSILRYVFPRWTIRPDGQYIKRYEWFRAVCAIISTFVFPNYLYLSLQFTWMRPLATLLDLCAYFDIVQRLLVGYYDERGILVYHPASAALHYFKGAFLVDLLASLPLEILDLSSSRMDSYKNKYHVIPPVAQYLMFNRVLQLYRLPSAFNTLASFINRDDILLIIKGLPFFLGLLNMMTSLIFLQSIKLYGPDTTAAHLMLEGESGWHFTEFPPRPNHTSWIVKAKELFSFEVLDSPLSFHLACYFWVVYEATSTGFNIFNPHQIDLLKIFSFGNTIARMVTTYFSVRVISLRANVNKALASFQEHMKDIKMYMIREKIPIELQKEVCNYYSYNWDKMSGTDYRSVLKLCDQITLRTDAILHIYGPTFHKCPVLLRSDVSLLRLIGRAVDSIYYLADSRFIEKDDVIEDLYFVDFGTVDIRSPDDDSVTLTKLPRGSIFGNLENQPTLRMTNAFVSDSNVHMLKIKTAVFYEIIEEFPNTKLLMSQFRANNEHYIIGGQKDPTRAMSVWKERAFSTAIRIATRKGAFKHLDIQHSKFMHTYLIIICLSTIYLETYNIAFQDNSLGYIMILYLLDFLFIFKIIINFALANADFDSEIKENLLSARKRYYRGTLKYDILSILPLELFCLLTTDLWMAFSFLRLNRLFRTVTISECLRWHHQKLNINLVLSTLISVTIWFTIFLHSMTCAWFFIGDLEDKRFPNTSWRHFSPLITPPCHRHYLCAFYFTLTTFTEDGVGDILPRTKGEVVFTCILQIISTMLYMIYVGEFSNVIQYQSFRFFEFYKKYVELMEYLKCTCVPKNLVEMMNRYSLHLWRESRGMQMPHFLETAPQCLHTKIMSAAYMTHLTQHPLFRSCEPAFNRQLVRHLRLYYYDAGMYVVKENEITDSMYMIHTGTVAEVAEDLEEQTQLLHEGDNFGIPQGLTRNTPFSHSYRALSKAQILTLRLEDWKYLVKHFPKSKSILFVDKDDEDKDKDRKRVQISKGPQVKSISEIKFDAELDDNNTTILSDVSDTVSLFPQPRRGFKSGKPKEEATPNVDIAKEPDDRESTIKVTKAIIETIPVKSLIESKAAQPLSETKGISYGENISPATEIKPDIEEHAERTEKPLGEIKPIVSTESVKSDTKLASDKETAVDLEDRQPALISQATVPPTLKPVADAIQAATSMTSVESIVSLKKSLNETEILAITDNLEATKSDIKLGPEKDIAETLAERQPTISPAITATPTESLKLFADNIPETASVKSSVKSFSETKLPASAESLKAFTNTIPTTASVKSEESAIRPIQSLSKTKSPASAAILEQPQIKQDRLSPVLSPATVSPTEPLKPVAETFSSDTITSVKSGEPTVLPEKSLSETKVFKELESVTKIISVDKLAENIEQRLPKVSSPTTVPPTESLTLVADAIPAATSAISVKDFVVPKKSLSEIRIQDSAKSSNKDMVQSLETVTLKPESGAFSPPIITDTIATPEKSYSEIKPYKTPESDTEVGRPPSDYFPPDQTRPMSETKKSVTSEEIELEHRKSSSANVSFGGDEDEDEPVIPKYTARRKSTVFAINRDEIAAELEALALEEEEEEERKAAAAIEEKLQSTDYSKRKSNVFSQNPDDLGRESEDDEDIELKERAPIEEIFDEQPIEAATPKESITEEDVTSEKDEPLELPMGDLSEPSRKPEGIKKMLFSRKSKSKPLPGFEVQEETLVDITPASELNVHTHFGEDDEEQPEIPKFTARRKSTVFAINRDEIAAELEALALEEEEEEEKNRTAAMTKPDDEMEKEVDKPGPSSSYNRRKSNVFAIKPRDSDEDEEGTITYDNITLEPEIRDDPLRRPKESITPDEILSEKDDPLELPMGDLEEPRKKSEAVRKMLFSRKSKSKHSDLDMQDLGNDGTLSEAEKHVETEHKSTSNIHTHFDADAEEQTDTEKYTARRKSTVFAINKEDIDAELEALALEEEIEEEKRMRAAALSENDDEKNYSHKRRKSTFFTVDKISDDEDFENEQEPEKVKSDPPKEESFHTFMSQVATTTQKEESSITTKGKDETSTTGLLSKLKSQSEFGHLKSALSSDKLDLEYKTLSVGSKRSILSFKDTIDTRYVAKKDELEVSDTDMNFVNETESMISILSYADDIAMKEQKDKDEESN